jgi:tRNA A-37 threonylcarbamoyl transferase component Bud32
MVGGYRIERRLGQGAMGTVYAAEEPTIRKRVAIKVLRRAFAEDPAMTARFEREARAVNEVRHPGLVDIFAIGRLDDGRPYLVMSLLEGRSLRDEIRARERLPPAEAWRIARAVAEAIDAVHGAGVVHRDLKPDNVFLERDGEGGPPAVRVLDFGIAKIDPIEGEPMKLTATGVPLGTPAYMSPEQWWGQGITARTDQYALGVVLHEMLTGRPPFPSENFAELVQQHVHEAPPTLAACGVAVPEAAQALVSRLLRKAPDDRFPSLREAIAAGDLAFSDAGEGPPATARARSADAGEGPPATARARSADAEALAAAATEMAPSTRAARPSQATRSRRRYLGLHAAILGGGLAALIVVGYAGYARHNPYEWIKIGGWGQHGVVLLTLAGGLGLARLSRRRAETGRPALVAFWLSLLPALMGAFTTYTGWNVILRAMPDVQALGRLTMFSEGTYEANGARFLGFAMSALLCLSLAVLPGVSGMAGATVTLPRAPGVRPREASAAALALGILAAFAAVVGAPSAALVSGMAAAVLGLGLLLPTVHAQTAARDELERAVAGVLAVALAAAVGITRLEAREAALWDSGFTRAERVAEIVAARGERDTTLPIATVSLLVVAAVEALRIRRLAQLGAVGRPRTATAALGTVLALGVTGDLVQHGRFIGKRDELRAEIASQFALFARLDPPPGDALDPARYLPQRATALQLTRDVLAVDGRGVARLSALASPEGAAQVATELNHALAQAGLALATPAAPAGVDLSISIDREVPGGTLLRVLRIARSAGVRRVDLLLTRGGAPRRVPGGPAEMDIVLPSDFVALPAELADDGALLGETDRFGSAAPGLVDQALAGPGPVRIAVR